MGFPHPYSPLKTLEKIIVIGAAINQQNGLCGGRLFVVFPQLPGVHPDVVGDLPRYLQRTGSSGYLLLSAMGASFKLAHYYIHSKKRTWEGFPAPIAYSQSIHATCSETPTFCLEEINQLSPSLPGLSRLL